MQVLSPPPELDDGHRMRTARNSSLRIHDDGLVSIEPVGGVRQALGRIGIDDIEPDLLPGERSLARTWKETSDFLRTHRIRSKVYLDGERKPVFAYGFLWISFSFDRGKARKRWGKGLDLKSLDQATETLANAIQEETYPDYHGYIEREPTRWVFQIDIMDYDPREKFFTVFFRALNKIPVLREYLSPPPE